jgi:hypothetical protein
MPRVWPVVRVPGRRAVHSIREQDEPHAWKEAPIRDRDHGDVLYAGRRERAAADGATWLAKRPPRTRSRPPRSSLLVLRGTHRRLPPRQPHAGGAVEFVTSALVDGRASPPADPVHRMGDGTRVADPPWAVIVGVAAALVVYLRYRRSHAWPLPRWPGRARTLVKRVMGWS